MIRSAESLENAAEQRLLSALLFYSLSGMYHANVCFFATSLSQPISRQP